MEENNFRNTSIILLNVKGLTKASGLLKITDKIIQNRAEEYFNMGFYLINSKHLRGITENFYKLILNNPYYLKENMFKYEFNNWSDFTSAMDCFSEVIKIQPKLAIAYNFRGVAQLKATLNNEFEYYLKEALDDISKAIELDPNFIDAYINRAIAKYSDGNIFSAYEDFKKAISINPTYFPIYFYRGQIYHDKFQFNEALIDFEKAIELEPNYPEAYLMRGRIKMFLEEYSEAHIDFNRAIELQADNWNFYKNRAWAKREMGDIQGAIKDETNSSKLFDKNAN